MSEAFMAGALERMAADIAARHAYCHDEQTRAQRIAHDVAAATGLTPEEAAHWVRAVVGPGKSSLAARSSIQRRRGGPSR